jgi:3-methyladenine DNA glycosylase AlkD
VVPIRLSARVVERRVLALRAPERAAALQRFFKTGPGEYGEGDRFLGLTMPQVRTLAADVAEIPFGELERLLESSWHEVRMLALVLMAARYPLADTRTQRDIYRLYLRRTDRINNWDLVDVTAPGVVGLHLLTRSRAVLRRLARSRSLWERRIAIVSTLTFIRHNQFADTLGISMLLMADRHDLMHKAVGWMLREVGKRDQPTLCRFLDAHAATMPRTMLRYAIERLPVNRRRHYMDARARG